MGSAFTKHDQVCIDERTAIEQLRARYPHVGQKALARIIGTQTFAENVDNVLARRANPRSFLSTYSVIRRFDAKNKTALGAA